MKPRAGYALIAALWLMVAISAAGTQLGLAARTRRLAAANTLEELRARNAALAAIAQVQAALDTRIARMNEVLSPADVLYDPWHGVETLLPDSLHFGVASAEVRIRDVGSMLDLNALTFDELRRFFTGATGSLAAGESFAARVLDWRDEDDAETAGGAELRSYDASGEPRVPRNAAYGDVRELKGLLGMDSTLFAAVSADLTVWAASRVNLNTASNGALLSLPGVSEESISSLAARRRAGGRFNSLLELANTLPANARQELESHNVVLSGRTTFTVNAVAVTVRARVRGSPRISEVEALIQRTTGYGRLKEMRWR